MKNGIIAISLPLSPRMAPTRRRRSRHAFTNRMFERLQDSAGTAVHFPASMRIDSS
jgi:hypothetical protein